MALIAIASYRLFQYNALCALPRTPFSPSSSQPTSPPAVAVLLPDSTRSIGRVPFPLPLASSSRIPLLHPGSPPVGIPPSFLS